MFGNFAVRLSQIHQLNWSPESANEKFNWEEVNRFLRERDVTLISAGLDEVPMACKSIREIMAAQGTW